MFPAAPKVNATKQARTRLTITPTPLAPTSQPMRSTWSNRWWAVLTRYHRSRSDHRRDSHLSPGDGYPEGTSWPLQLSIRFRQASHTLRIVPVCRLFADTAMTVPADISGANNDALPPTFSLTASSRAVLDPRLTPSPSHLAILPTMTAIMPTRNMWLLNSMCLSTTAPITTIPTWITTTTQSRSLAVSKALQFGGNPYRRALPEHRQVCG